jgi:glutamate-ammonia-ligase adenylyltransferase
MNEALFHNPDAANRARERMEELTGIDIGAFFDTAFEGNPAPDLALTNLERWLRATSNPGLYLEQLAGWASMGRLLIQLFGASQPVADTLIQNPELASLVFDPSEMGRMVTSEAIKAEGKILLAAATSYLHALDRLRFLRQRWNLPIVINDLSGSWAQETVWRALSDLADALIELTVDVAWKEFAAQKSIDARPDFMIVGFGKLGGSELNYSSDVDLVYVVEDGLDERSDRDCTRFFEAFGRALSDRMGRGSLFRVDLRLRPYGGAGPILRSMRSFEAYYQLYAEPWEVQALLRSRPIVGSDSLRARWETIRTAHCFRSKLSEIGLEQMLAMKARIEDGAADGDIKRGEGGIRDVEFIAQILQMLHGIDTPDLQVRATCDALRSLESTGHLEHSVAGALIDGYEFLRKLEHRTQLVRDQQTHTIPTGGAARETLAMLMKLSSWPELSGRLEGHRRTIQNLYRSTLSLELPLSGDRSTVHQKLGPLGAAALHWFDGLPESEAFYHGLVENPDSLERVQRMLSDAPRLVTYFKSSVSLTELLMSGEILEVENVARRIQMLPLDAPIQLVADVYLHAYAVTLGQWVLEPGLDLGIALAHLIDSLVLHCCARLEIDFDVLGLGSYGAGEPGPGSDADLLFLIADPAQQLTAERQAQQLLALLSQLRRSGAPVEIDLRLRPEGGKGLLVRTFDGLRAYDFDGMQMWERFALGHARLVRGSEEALKLVQHCAYGLPLTPERLQELVKMKRRVETERVKPQHVHRQVKLGSGGLNDIEWLVHLHEMRYPTATKAGEATRMDERIRRVAGARLLNALEAELLLEAREFLLTLRARIFLLGIDEDLLPENPDKLDRLARSCGFADGNSLLGRHQSLVGPVRRMYTEGLNRLKS